MELRTRAWAEETLLHKTSKRPLDRRKLQNNTYLERRDNGDIAVKFHATDVVTYHPDGSIGLDTGGWYSMITRERMDTYAGPFGIMSVNARWQLIVQNPECDDEWHEIEYDDSLIVFSAENRELYKVRGMAENVRFGTRAEAYEARTAVFGEAPPYWKTVGMYYDGMTVWPDDILRYEVNAEAEALAAQDDVTIKALKKYLRNVSEERDHCTLCRIGNRGREHLMAHLETGTITEEIAREAVSEAGYRPDFVSPRKRMLRDYFKARLLVGNYGGRRPIGAVNGTHWSQR